MHFLCQIASSKNVLYKQYSFELDFLNNSLIQLAMARLKLIT